MGNFSKKTFKLAMFSKKTFKLAIFSKKIKLAVFSKKTFRHADGGFESVPMADTEENGHPAK